MMKVINCLPVSHSPRQAPLCVIPLPHTLVFLPPCMNAPRLWPPAAHPKALQALVLSHELENEEEMTPYLQEVLQPLRPLVVYGRAAALPPQWLKKEAVYDGWRDPKGPSLCRSLALALSAPCLIRRKGCARRYTCMKALARFLKFHRPCAGV